MNKYISTVYLQHCTVIHTRHPRLIRRLLATDTLLFRHFCLVGIKFCRHFENLFSTLIFVQIDENKVSQCTFLRHSAVHMMDNNRNMRYQYVLARTGLSDANDRIPPLQQYFYFLGKVLQLLSVLGSLMYVLIRSACSRQLSPVNFLPSVYFFIYLSCPATMTSTHIVIL